MELFTLGEGHYTEQDIKEAARAFTGWSSIARPAGIRFGPALHDYGVKTCSAKTAASTATTCSTILLATARDAEIVTSSSGANSSRPTSIRPRCVGSPRVFANRTTTSVSAARALLTSDAFFCAEHRGALVEIADRARRRHAARRSSSQPDETLPFAVAAAGMGQKPVLAAERQGLVRRRGVDQLRRRCLRATAFVDRDRRAATTCRPSRRIAGVGRSDRRRQA
jgi:hypothetical protein